MKEVNLPYARCDITKKPVAAAFYEGEEDLRCYECEGTLYYRNGCERRGKNGTLHHVRPHFYHLGESSCRGESVVHLMAKDIVANQKRFEFYHQCGRCNEAYPVEIHRPGFTPKQEHHWRTADDNTPFIPDVAFFDQNDEMRTVVEICHTHRIPDKKIVALNKAAIVWVEVDADHVIQRFNENQHSVFVMKSSVIHGDSHCTSCVATLEKERLEREALVHEKKEAERRERMLVLERQVKEEERKRLFAEEQRKRVIREKEEELENNEKKRRAYYDKQQEEQVTKKAKLQPLSGERRLELEYQFENERQRLDYEDRKKHLMAYQNMIVEARRRKKNSSHATVT